MRITIIGSGAVGAYYGGRLALAGHEVFFVARGATLKALTEEGIRSESIHGDFSVGPVRAGQRPPEEPADWAIVCVKSYDTEAALELIQPAVGPNTSILSLQNGLENEEKLMERFGEKKVIGGLCYIGSEMTQPGVVRHVADGRVIFGEWDGSDSQRCQRLCEAMNEANIPAHQVGDISKLLWGKLLWNTAFNTTCALARAEVGAVMSNPASRALAEAIMEEVAQAAEASGTPLGRPIIEASLAHTDKELGDVRPSMLQDVLKGRRLEHQTFCGYVERVGKKHGFPTPICSTLNALLDVLDQGRRVVGNG